MQQMNPEKLTKWSLISGFTGLILYVVALVLLLMGSILIADRLDHKDLYYAGTGLILTAIWFKLGAIYHKGGM